MRSKFGRGPTFMAEKGSFKFISRLHCTYMEYTYNVWQHTTVQVCTAQSIMIHNVYFYSQIDTNCKYHHHEQSDVTCCTLTDSVVTSHGVPRILHLAFHPTRSWHIDSSFSMALMSRSFRCMSLLDRSC